LHFRTALADDGYNLWLKYPKVNEPERLKEYRQTISSIILSGNSATCRIIHDELKNGLYGLLGSDIPFANSNKSGSLIIGTPRTSEIINKLNVTVVLDKLGKEGYLIKSITIKGKRSLVIIASDDIGLLYGTFHLLRLIQTHRSIKNLDIISRPKIQNRILNHWDNLDGSVERGYAGKSLWKWDDLPGLMVPYSIMSMRTRTYSNPTILKKLQSWQISSVRTAFAYSFLLIFHRQFLVNSYWMTIEKAGLAI
jgi:alpha-glucuronidase